MTTAETAETGAGRAPLAELQRLGFIRITVDGAVVAHRDTVALHDPTLVGRINRHYDALARAITEASLALEAWWERRGHRN